MTEQDDSNNSPDSDTIQCNETLAWGNSNPTDVRTAAYILAFAPVLILLLNTVAIFYISRAKRLKRHTRMFILSLIISDTLTASVVLPFKLYNMLSDGHSRGTICKFGYSFDVFLSLVPMFTVAILAFDRYISTCKPFQVGLWFRGYNSLLMLVIAWMIPAITGFVLIPLDLTTKGIDDKYKCLMENATTCLFFSNVPFAAYQIVIFACLSGFVILCNRFTLLSVEKRTRLFYDVIFSTKPIPIYKTHFGSKVARMIVWITCCCILFRFPYFTVNVIDPMFGYRVPSSVWIVVKWMVYANSALNPVLYLTFTGVLKLE